MIGFLNKWKYPFILLVAVAAIAAFFTLQKNKAPKIEFVEAKRGDLIQELSVTGRVKPVESVELAFERSGRISKVYVEVGDKVKIGDRLIALDNADLMAELAKAKANAKSEEARLKDLIAGAKAEEINVQKVKVSGAEVALVEAKKTVLDNIEDAYTKSDNAIRNKADSFFNTPQAVPSLKFSTFNANLEKEIERERGEIENMLREWKNEIGNLELSGDLKLALKNSLNNLNKIKLFLDDSALLINNLAPSATLAQSSIDAWKANLFEARTEVSAAITNILNANEKLTSAESTLALAKEELALKISSATPEEIQAQEARVEEAKANIQNILVQLDKTVIRSPINGVVTKQDGKIGEVVSPNFGIVSVISDADLEIEANIPEADIAKLELGDLAKITLDAYTEDDIFEARVTMTDPAETIIEGVPVYKTTLEFTKEDGRIRPGMTANVDIATDKKNNVITVPQRAVIRKNGGKIVRLLKNGEIVDAEVKTGIVGSDGRVEIISGVNEGDKVITFLEGN